ncbi:hypothetical protein [Actinoplanes philippinensis]|uniref:hypothetical protein n=1 Tax=Actinoplanes philippinensis TaxID=35752 RepID=UPI0033E72283
MFVRRIAATALVTAAAVPVAPSPAQAHGAPMTPISRSAACFSPASTLVSVAACTAVANAASDCWAWAIVVGSVARAVSAFAYGAMFVP